MSIVHSLTDENSRFRRWSLYLFARYLEMPLLGWSYQLLRGRYRRLGQNGIIRAGLGWSIGAPFGHLVETGRPMPTDKVLEMIDRLEGPIAVGPCRCRSAHRACAHPLETDIVIRTGVEAWTHAFPREYRLIDSAEAKSIVAECQRLGLWQMVFLYCPANAQNEYVICNCCRCGCVPYVLNRDLGQRVYPLLRGAYVSHTDADRCTGHGDCVAACPFGARTLRNGKAVLENPCFGCGLCASECPEKAIVMREV